jgi:hypothetical protein
VVLLGFEVQGSRFVTRVSCGGAFGLVGVGAGDGGDEVALVLVEGADEVVRAARGEDGELGFGGLLEVFAEEGPVAAEAGLKRLDDGGG